jgi:hypothetical protein
LALQGWQIFCQQMNVWRVLWERSGHPFRALRCLVGKVGLGPVNCYRKHFYLLALI